MQNTYYSKYLVLADYKEDLKISTVGYSCVETIENEARNKYKTEICRNWEIGNCEFGNSCSFAHGYEELRNKVNMGNNYKTKKCKQFHEIGFCIYGNRCQFKHRDSSSDTSSSPNRQKTQTKAFRANQ